MAHYFENCSSAIQKKNEQKLFRRRVKVKPYSQCTREGNQAYPVFDGLKDKTTENKR